MASKQAAAKRAPAHQRTTGRRKTAKKADIVTSTPRTRPRPRPTGRAALESDADFLDDKDDEEDFNLQDISLFDIAENIPDNGIDSDQDSHISDYEEEAPNNTCTCL